MKFTLSNGLTVEDTDINQLTLEFPQGNAIEVLTSELEQAIHFAKSFNEGRITQTERLRERLVDFSMVTSAIGRETAERKVDSYLNSQQ